jgi:sugar/nucleoside kinase (ribokinase family)
MIGESAFKSASLCVVGNINRDVKTAPIPGGDFLLRDGETPVASVIETIGGGGANSACAAAALGAKVAFLGKVGTDSLGAVLQKTLRKNGVAAHLAKDKRHPTGTSINLVYENGRRHFLSSLPNNRSLAFKDLDLSILPRFTHLLRADIWFSEHMLFGGNAKLFATARKAGMSISIDLNWDPEWSHASPGKIRERKKAVRAVLPWVDLAHGNVRELNEFADSADLPTTLKRLTKWGARAVVLHLGGKGAGYFENGKLSIEPPAPVRRHVHATGTGDVLSVCMMLLHQNKRATVPEKLRLANAIVSQFIEGKRQFIPSLAGSAGRQRSAEL